MKLHAGTPGHRGAPIFGGEYLTVERHRIRIRSAYRDLRRGGVSASGARVTLLGIYMVGVSAAQEAAHLEYMAKIRDAA